MINDYVRMVHSALMNDTQEKIIMIHKSKLTKDDIILIKELKELYNKEVKISTLQEIMTNKDANVHVVE